MFDFLFGKAKPTRLPDRVWMDASAKWAGLGKEAAALRAQGEAVLIAAFFPETLTAVEAAVPGSRRLSGTLSPEQALSAPQPLLWLWSETAAADAPSARIPAAGRLAVLVAEHHPLPESDSALLSLFKTWPGEITARFFADLDEPLFAAVGGTRLKPLMEKLGMKEGEAIESRLVTRQIAAAQKRIASRARTRTPASSQAAWFAANYGPFESS